MSLHAENVGFINQVLACIRLKAYSVFVWDVSEAGNLSLLASHIVMWSIFNFCCNCNDWKLIQYNGKNAFAIDNEASLFQFFSQQCYRMVELCYLFASYCRVWTGVNSCSQSVYNPLIIVNIIAISITLCFFLLRY